MTSTGFQVAFLQANSPLQSVSSGYTLSVMEQDGSNVKAIFPISGETALKPQNVNWSPNGKQLALIHRGNLWIVGNESSVSQQLTSDGQTSKPSWAH
jgi:Tol biopolymer transport system component